MICSSGEACAIWQAEAVYGPQPGPWECVEGFDTRGRLSLMNCNNHPNPNNPIYTLGGFAWPVCDAGETGSASGCDYRKEKDDRTCPRVGDPVDPKLGVLTEEITDFRIGSQTPLELRRIYWSDPYVEGMMDNHPLNSRLGSGWRTNFDAHASFWPDGNEMPGGVIITYPSGRQIHFETRGGRYVAGLKEVLLKNLTEAIRIEIWRRARLCDHLRLRGRDIRLTRLPAVHQRRGFFYVVGIRWVVGSKRLGRLETK
jgi:hypothetical protein